MRLRRPDLGAALALAAILVAPVAAQPARERQGGGAFGLSGFGGKEPITVTSDTLEFDYKSNVVVYRGSVEVTQGQTKLRSDNLTITLAAADRKPGEKPAGDEPATDPAADGKPTAAADERVQEIVASGNVRIDQGTRRAVGGRAVFDQSRRTLVLSESPVLHDGPNEVAGDRVIVYLDEDRSVVEGGRKRVKAVLYPDQKKPGEGGDQ